MLSRLLPRCTQRAVPLSTSPSLLCIFYPPHALTSPTSTPWQPQDRLRSPLFCSKLGRGQRHMTEAGADTDIRQKQMRSDLPGPAAANDLLALSSRLSLASAFPPAVSSAPFCGWESGPGPGLIPPPHSSLQVFPLVPNFWAHPAPRELSRTQSCCQHCPT